jgi:chlorite dismutase
VTTRLTFFLHLTARPDWLALTRPERRQVISTHVAPVLGRYPQVTLRWFDAEAFSAVPSDVVVAETDDVTAWTDLVEELRDTPLWAVPYFDVHALIPAVEDGFREHETRTVR